MESISTFVKNNYSVLLIGLVFSLGCECCCECKNEGVGTLTISISFAPTYMNRDPACPIPVPSGALTGVGGNKVTTLDDEPFHTATSYYLWVEFESCCDDYQFSSEYQALATAGTAKRSVFGAKKATYTIALNTVTGSTSPTFPIPTSSSQGNGIEGGTVRVYYWEPCMTVCESPLPNCGAFSFRPTYEGVASTTLANITVPVILMHAETQCENSRGFRCAP